MFLETKSIVKKYKNGDAYSTVLNEVSIQVDNGEMCAVFGPSGSGKSTFLNVVGGLDSIDKGSIVVDGLKISSMNAKALSEYRRSKLGFIFQFYNLVPDLSVKENIETGSYLSENPLNLDEMLEMLGLTEHKNKFPAQLSGGQQQRCAIGRALIKNPELLLCDEPTGALDYTSSKEILEIIEEINQKYGTTIIMVTHNNAIKEMVHKGYGFKDGRIDGSFKNDQIINAKDLEW